LAQFKVFSHPILKKAPRSSFYLYPPSKADFQAVKSSPFSVNQRHIALVTSEGLTPLFYTGGAQTADLYIVCCLRVPHTFWSAIQARLSGSIAAAVPGGSDDSDHGGGPFGVNIS